MAGGKTGNEGYRDGPYLSGRFLLIPSTARGNGMGHIKRSLHLCKQLPDAYIYIPETSTDSQRGTDELEELLEDFDRKMLCTSLKGILDIETVILDMRRAPEDIVRTLAAHRRSIALDEGGYFRSRFGYLIDTLANLEYKRPPNIFSPFLLDLPRRKREEIRGSRDVLRVLLSFGGEDPAGLTVTTAKTLLRIQIPAEIRCTAVMGPLAVRQELPSEVNLLEYTPNLKEQFADYDVVITSFGLSAYEAASAGCGVICISPGRYHRKLTRTAGFEEAGTGRVRARRLKRILNNFDRLFERSGAVRGDRREEEEESLAGFIEALSFSSVPACPVCLKAGLSSVFRNKEKTVFLCPACGLYVQIHVTGTSPSYDSNYFFSEYKAQYGKTYLEDFDHIKSLGKKRIGYIRSLAAKGLGKRPFRVLDVGCAYGAFLQALSEEGFAPEGIDISQEAAEYVEKKLGISAAALDFENPGGADENRLQGPYDAVTMWYVIEHFEKTARVLRRVSDLLPAGGIFAFSTPNGGGISRRCSADSFFTSSPKDHVTIWTPKSAKKVLPVFGFRVVKVRVTGHHPERFPWKAGGRGFGYKLTMLLSRLWRLGDTFEVYAVKTDQAEG